MKLYKIKYISKIDVFYLVAVTDTDGIIKSIELPYKLAENLQVGQSIVALQNKDLEFEDYVYLFDNKMYMNIKLPVADEYFCKIYIDNLMDGADKKMFKNALERECRRHNITVDAEDWVNLHNMVLWDWLGRIVVKQP